MNASRRLLGVLGAVTIAGLVLAGCVGSSNEEPEQPDTQPGEAATWEDVIEQAQQEGSVTLYSSASDEQHADLASRMEELYGIEVRYNKFSTADLAQRLDSEVRADNIQVDVAMQSDEASFSELANQGAFEQLYGPEIDKVPAEHNADGLYIDIGLTAWTLFNNTGLADRPSTWEDLASPQYQGEIVAMDSMTSVPFAQFWWYMTNEFGEEWLEGIGANQPTIQASGAGAAAMIIGGEGSIGLPMTSYFAAAQVDMGAPVEMVIPEPITAFARSLAVFKEASHPAAAMLLANFIASEEGQAIMNGNERGTSPLYEIDGDIDLPGDVVVLRTNEFTEDQRNSIREMWQTYILG